MVKDSLDYSLGIMTIVVVVMLELGVVVHIEVVSVMGGVEMDIAGIYRY